MSASTRPSLWGCAVSLLVAGAPGCAPSAVRETAPPPKTDALEAKAAPPGAPEFNRIARLDFNRRAAEQNQPFFWRSDANSNGALEPSELALTWSHQTPLRTTFIDARGAFTPEFSAAYEQLARPIETIRLPPEELKRRNAVRLELAQGRPTLVESDFSKEPDPDKQLLAHVQRIAVWIERLYAKQKGNWGLEAKLVPGDAASAALFFRNQGPECRAPKTERDPDCHALPEPTTPAFGLYPADIQSDPKFCELLSTQKNRAKLVDHFSVVVKGETPGAFKAVPYSQAFAEEMTAIAAELDAAASDLAGEEPALKAYLTAAAQSFRSNDWEPANRAWVNMGTGNSKYYLRVGPDEVYYEPCAWKAGFALAFARINPDSVTWRERLEPIKQDLEDDLARLAGKPYQPRAVHFKLPDFIDIVLNAADNRAPIGATVGQSLPNWGPVAEQGGRTVTMTNLYTDEDSREALKQQMSSLYCKASMAAVDPKPLVMGVVLHEAAHNLGPAHDYQVNGKVDTAIFGGPLASTLEELKAQSAALYFTTTLVDRKLITQREADIEHLQDVAWAFGHIAQGMYDAQGKPKNYSQLAAIQLGSLRESGALEWKPTELSAEGHDPGCFEVHLERWNAAAAELAARVLQIKGRGDRANAEALKERYVDRDDEFKKLRDLIAARWLRSPKASFVYSVSGSE